MTIGSQVGGLVNDASSAVGGMVSNVGSTVSSVTDMISHPEQLLTAARKTLLPLGGNTFTSLLTTLLDFGDSDDWRVRLSIPLNFMALSAVFNPLKQAGGFVFPYTPNITISGNAEYTEVNVTHQNFPFLAYQHSKPGEITITGEFIIQNSDEAKYWIACVHFLRTVTKMYSGSTGTKQGSPPPILFLNGYGDFVFKQIPVVVTNFSIDMKNDCDYIRTKPEAGFDLSANNVPSKIFSLLQSSLTAEELVGGAISTIGSKIMPSESHVPTKSNITITLKTAYSREAVKQFSLQSFANGNYILGGFI